MVTDLPILPDWVLIKAARLGGFIGEVSDLQYNYKSIKVFRALCDMIAKHEQPPVDRKLLCAREAMREQRPDDWPETACIRAIELWEEGFGK
jgi:hypothetical protein